MKRTFIILCCLATVFSALATRPLRRAYAHRQADGKSITIFKEGNAKSGFYSTTDGLALLLADDGNYYYATPGTSGDGLAFSKQLAHNANQRDAEEQAFVSEQALSAGKAYSLLQPAGINDGAARMKLKNAALTADGLGQYGKSAGGALPSIGTITIPVIMVSFPDREFQTTTTIEKVTRRLNEKGYADENYCVGSVKDYFTDQSNGLFVPSFDVVASVKASKNYAYYGKNEGADKDKNCLELVREALDSAIASGADLSKYLVNNSTSTSAIPLVSIFYAGPGEHSAYEEGSENYLWAHFQPYSYTSSKNSKIRISSFFVGNETFQDYVADEDGNPVLVGPGKIDGIGVFCHELGHALGLPDFYKTDGAQTYITPDFWSVMDYGQYWRNGYAPIGYNAYERCFVGWLNLTDISEAQQVTLNHFGMEGGTQAVRIVNPKEKREYYIIENRQNTKWYPSQLGHGLLVTHIDYNATDWSLNTLNNKSSHLRFTVLPADDVNQARSMGAKNAEFAGDLYPGTQNVTQITKLPVFNGGLLNYPIHKITENSDQTVTFAFIDETVGIETVGTESGSQPSAYTIDGRKVRAGSSLGKGIYIVNGKKIIK